MSNKNRNFTLRLRDIHSKFSQAKHYLRKAKLIGGFNPSEKYFLVKLHHFPKVRGENEQVFETTT